MKSGYLAPLSEGNWLQRRYARWAEPHYAKMEPALRDEVERLDRWLYCRNGLPAWLGLLAAVAMTTLAIMRSLDMGWLRAGALSLAGWSALLFSLASAWLRPEQFDLQRRVPLRELSGSLALGLAGAACGFLIARLEIRRGLDLAALPTDFDSLLGSGLRGLDTLLGTALPVVLAILLPIALLQFGIAALRRQAMARQMGALRLAQERDAAAREVAEARLKLLQAQIHPHFIFNTLSAVQHWVDGGDPRAGALLRSLSAFLRGSTEMLGRERVTLAEEADIARHYLAIMQARMGERLRPSLALEPAAAAVALPPGLLLTLVENAVEHGAQPSLQGADLRVSARVEEGGQALEANASALMRRLVIEVRDTGPGLPAAAPGPADAPASPAFPNKAGFVEGTGLSNSRARLRQIYGDTAALTLANAADGPGCVARLELPVETSAQAPSEPVPLLPSQPRNATASDLQNQLPNLQAKPTP